MQKTAGVRRDTARLSSALPLLLSWYETNRRPMPWREDPDAYRVWVSEIMLQQTRVEAVIPYYERFLSELPTVEALSCVSDERLMKLWEGLGYYSRARNLKRAACGVMERFGGELPDSVDRLLTLPGIGAYTAGAIASIAYGKPEPAVDGNVLRVVSRLCALHEDVTKQKTKDGVTELLRSVYPTGKAAGDTTSALMELGQVVCVPLGEPRCAECPLRTACRAYEEGRVTAYPVRSPNKPRRVEQRTVLLLCAGDRYAIRRRPDTGLLSGLWEYPSFDGTLTEEEVRQFLASSGFAVLSVSPCGDATHIFTHVEWRMHGFFAEVTPESRDANGDYLWERAEEIRETRAIPTAYRFYSSRMTERKEPEKT